MWHPAAETGRGVALSVSASPSHPQRTARQTAAVQELPQDAGGRHPRAHRQAAQAAKTLQAVEGKARQGMAPKLGEEGAVLVPLEAPPAPQRQVGGGAAQRPQRWEGGGAAQQPQKRVQLTTPPYFYTTVPSALG